MITGANKKTALLICGKFNGNLDDGGTLSILTTIKKLQARGVGTYHLEVVSPLSGEQTIAEYRMKAERWSDDHSTAIAGNNLSFTIMGIPANVRFVPYDIFALYRKPDNDAFDGLTSEIVNRLYETRPDIVITTQEDIFSLWAASKADIPYFHIFSSAVFKYDDIFLKLYKNEFRESMAGATIVAFNQVLAKEVSYVWGKEVIVLPAIIEFDSFVAKSKRPEYITFVNYHPHKGAVIFWHLVRKLRNEKFLLLDKHDLFKCEEGMNNIEVIKHESDMRKIYAVTKILLAPSLIEESYCRVIAEAMANGIPVIANRVEGIKDIWHRAAFLVDINLVDRGKADYYTNFIYHIDSYQRYIELINALGSDRKMYEEASARSLAEAEVVRKDQSDALDNFARILSGAGDVHVNV